METDKVVAIARSGRPAAGGAMVALVLGGALGCGSGTGAPDGGSSPIVRPDSGGVVTPDAGPQTPPYLYVDWMSAQTAQGTASGSISLPDGTKVSVSFSSVRPDGAGQALAGAGVSHIGTNYWLPAAPYISELVPNAPPTSDIIELDGKADQTCHLTLSEPVVDPVIPIYGLGLAKIPLAYDFAAPFTIVSWTVGTDGGATLVERSGDVAEGRGGSGTLRFVGTYSAFSWSISGHDAWNDPPSIWSGFTFGIRTTQRASSDGGS